MTAVVIKARRLGWSLVAFIAFLAGSLGAQEVLNNEAIMKMVKAGLSESSIIQLIQQQPGNYSTSLADILALRETGVPSAVIDAMIAKASRQAAPPKPASNAAAQPPRSEPAGSPLVTDVGVYYKKGDQWVELLPEVVNWRTGGVLKIHSVYGRCER